MHYLDYPSHGVDLLTLQQRNPERYPSLLESVAEGSNQARYSILFAFPGDSLVLREQGLYYQDRPLAESNFLNQLDRLWRQEAATVASDEEPDLPFRGGWFLYLGYELAAQIEPSLHLPAALDGMPIALATRIPAAFVMDRQHQRLYLLSEDNSLLALMEEDLHQQPESPTTLSETLALDIHEEEPEHHRQVVERAKRYIVDGDIFQANLSRLWRGQLQEPVSNADLYRRLRIHNPAPFAGMLVFEGAAVISSSPERLVEVHKGVVQTRPIAGTRPRHSQGEDEAVTAELIGHPKERAEHIMLIDLERNDLGRIAKPGTVEVNELMVTESYAHVHHIVSNVRGHLRPDVSPGQVIAAVFPGGTITGCPKVRCMEIIAEQEGEGRGAYTGSMGYLNHNGDMDLNILIRTLVRHGDEIRLRAGGGIVVDSEPEAELNETRAKARGLLRALGVTW